MASNGSFKTVKRFGVGDGGLAPVCCTRPNCRGSIPANVLAHKLHMGWKEQTKCLECAKLKPAQTRYYKLPPGAERLFTFKPKVKAQAPAKPNGAKPVEQKLLQAANDKITQLQKQLKEAVNVKQQGEANPAVNKEGFNKEDSMEIKAISKQLSKLEDLEEDEVALFFPVDGSYAKRIKELQEQRQNIWAKNRARLPVKEQWEKQRVFVAKCEADLKSVKDEQNALMLKYHELEKQVNLKTAILAEKKLELAELASKAAQEDAVDAAVPPQPNKQEGGLGQEQVNMFNILKTMLSKSNVHAAMVQEGASPEQLASMEQMWADVGKVVERSKAPTPKEAKPPENFKSDLPKASESQAAASNAADAVNVPVQKQDNMDADMEDVLPTASDAEIEAAWANHVDSNQEISTMANEDRQQRKAAFETMFKASKKAKVVKS